MSWSRPIKPPSFSFVAKLRLRAIELEIQLNRDGPETLNLICFDVSSNYFRRLCLTGLQRLTKPGRTPRLATAILAM